MHPRQFFDLQQNERNAPNNSLCIAYFQSYRLFILTLQAEKEIILFTQKLHVQIENLERHGSGPYPNI
jgi:hypothetical protein